MSGQEDADETVSRKGLFVFEEIYAFSTSADVRIDASASFRSAGLHMIALACSNNELVILQCYRNSTWQRTPYKWCHDPMRTITCLVFSPCGQYLICLLISGCLEVIPIHLITAAKYCKSAQEIDEELFDQNDLTYIPIQVRDDCLSQPTCALWYQTRSNKPVLVYGNKGGDIVFFDLCLRRLTVSLQAPQSIHNIELFTSDCIDVYLLVTGFAGSQWLIPLEKDGSTLRETLGSVIPSMLKELSVKSRVFSVPFGECSSFAISSGCSLQLYHTASLINPFWEVVLPDEGWKVFSIGYALFLLTANFKLYCLILRGCTKDQSSAMREKFTFYCGNMDMESGFVGFASTANDDDDNESPLVSLPSCIVITSSSVFKVHCRCSIVDILVDMFASTNDAGLVKLWSEALNVEFVSLGQRLVNAMIAAKKRESAFELSLLVERSKVDVVSAFLRNGEEQFILNRVQQWLRSGSLEATAASQLSSLALQAYLKKAVADTSELERTNSGFRNFLTSCRFADSTQCLRPLIDAHLYHSALIFVQAHRAGPQLTQCLCSLSFWPTIGSFVALLTASEVVQLFDDEGDRCNLLALLQRLSSFLLHANSRLVWQIWKAYNLRQKRVRAFLAEAQLKSNPNCTDIAKAVVSLFLKAAIFLNWELRDAAFASLSVPGYHTAKIPLSCNNSGCAFIDANQRVHFLGKQDSIVPSSPQDSIVLHVIDYFERTGLKLDQIACGAKHVLFLASNSVYSLGDNKYGQLGLPGIADRLGTIGVLDVKCFLAHVCQVTCGHYHSCVVDCDGNAYSWGWNVHGQLGHGTVQAVKLPKLIAEFQRQRCSVVSVAGGMAHTVFLCASGAVYACGSNAYGQLGIQYSSTEKKCSLPLKVPLPKKIRLLCAGSFRNLALADSAEDSPELFAWGISPQTLKFLMIVQKQTKRTANEGGDPGNRQSLRGYLERYACPKRVNTTEVVGNVTQLQCGLNHFALLTDLGDLYMWGKNYDHQLGLGDKKERDNPSPVLSFGDRAICYVACGPFHTVAVDDSGYLWGWGKNDIGQLGFRFDGDKASDEDSTAANRKEKTLTIALPNRSPKTFHLGCDVKKSVPTPTVLDDVSSLAVNGEHPALEDVSTISLLVSLIELKNFYEPDDLISFCTGKMTVAIHSFLLFLKGDFDELFDLLVMDPSRSPAAVLDFIGGILARVARPEVTEKFFVSMCVKMTLGPPREDGFSFENYLLKNFEIWRPAFLSTFSLLAGIPSFRRTFAALAVRCLRKTKAEVVSQRRPTVTCILQDDLRDAAEGSSSGEEVLVFHCGHCMTRQTVLSKLQSSEVLTCDPRFSSCVSVLQSLFTASEPIFSSLCFDCIERILKHFHDETVENEKITYYKTDK